jgi:hypothetical protein
MCVGTQGHILTTQVEQLGDTQSGLHRDQETRPVATACSAQNIRQRSCISLMP